MNKVEKILKGNLDSIPSPSPSVQIQIMGGKVCLRRKGKSLLGIDNIQQCFAFTPLHWRWRWWDQIRAIFLNLFYFNLEKIAMFLNSNEVEKNRFLLYKFKISNNFPHCWFGGSGTMTMLGSGTIEFNISISSWSNLGLGVSFSRLITLLLSSPCTGKSLSEAFILAST